jgi:hypothetical protein
LTVAEEDYGRCKEKENKKFLVFPRSVTKLTVRGPAKTCRRREQSQKEKEFRLHRQQDDAADDQ